MKKWQKRVLIILIVFATIVAGLSLFFKVYIEPKLEKALEKVQVILQDESLQKEIDVLVDELIENGTLSIVQIEGYLYYKDAKEAEAVDSQSADVAEVTEKSAAVSEDGSASADVTTAPESRPTATQNSTSVKTESAQKPKTLMERVKEAMTAEEFNFAMSMYFKVDANYIISNIRTDRAGVKKYVKSKLTSEEIARSLEIYGKYSYLLK